MLTMYRESKMLYWQIWWIKWLLGDSLRCVAPFLHTCSKIPKSSVTLDGKCVWLLKNPPLIKIYLFFSSRRIHLMLKSSQTLTSKWHLIISSENHISNITFLCFDIFTPFCGGHLHSSSTNGHHDCQAFGCSVRNLKGLHDFLIARDNSHESYQYMHLICTAWNALKTYFHNL